MLISKDSLIEDNPKLFCFSLKTYSSTWQFLICSSAVFIFYISYGYILELIFTLDGMKEHSWFLTMVQFGLYSIFALLQLKVSGVGLARRISARTYLLIACLTVGTMGFSNSSMGFLNYPTQVIFKSCKLIPVMIGSVIILKKRYSFLQVLACVCMCVGLIWFTLADSTVQPTFTFKGILYVSLALLCDAIIGNVQEGAMKKFKESSTHVVLYSYFFGFLIIFFILIITEAFTYSLSFSLKHPWEIYGRCFALSVMGFCGVQIVLQLISQFGAVVAVTVTTFRKAISICLSFFFFSKPFTIQYVFGGMLVALGIYLNIYSKQNLEASFLIQLQKIILKSKNFIKSFRHKPPVITDYTIV